MSKTKTAKIYDEETKEIRTIDVSDKHLEKIARGYILGTQKFDNQKELREKLEGKVVRKIGRKGKFLTDKLFELIEGVYIIDKRAGKDGTTIKYYQVPPSLQAIIYALDRVLGKPKTVTEINENKQGIILVEHIIKGLVTNPRRENNGKNGVGKNVLGVTEIGSESGGESAGNSNGSIDDTGAGKAVI